MSNWTLAHIEAYNARQKATGGKRSPAHAAEDTAVGGIARPEQNLTAKTGVSAPGATRQNKRGRKIRTWDPSLTLECMVRCGLPEPVTEHRFHPVRKWRFDFAWPDALLYLEVEGGIYTEGAHGSIGGALRDIEKYNAAATLGWTGIRALPEWLPGDRGLSIDGELVASLQKIINLKTPKP